MHGCDDLFGVDAPEVVGSCRGGVPKLTLDHVQRHTFMGELDRVGVAQLTRREAAPDACLGGEPVEFDAYIGARSRPPAGRAVDHAEQRSDRQRDPRREPW
jgi:hypothetical protein